MTVCILQGSNLHEDSEILWAMAYLFIVYLTIYTKWLLLLLLLSSSSSSSSSNFSLLSFGWEIFTYPGMQ